MRKKKHKKKKSIVSARRRKKRAERMKTIRRSKKRPTKKKRKKSPPRKKAAVKKAKKSKFPLQKEKSVAKTAVEEVKQKIAILKKKLPREADDEESLGEELTLDKTPMRIYLQQIENIPLLTPEDEVKFAKKVAEKGEDAKEARIRMIRSNLRLVISIAKRYANIGLPFSDLVEEGNIGLMRAVDKFNYKKGYRFSTYASWWIKQAMMRALSNQGKMIRIPVYMYDIISRWRKVKDGMTQKLGRAPTRKEVADTMELPIRKVKEIERIASQPSSLNAPINIEGAAEVIDLVEDEAVASATDNIQELFTSERIDRLLGYIDERERSILTLRFGLGGGEPKTLEDTAQQFNITRERVRQIEVAALKKIRYHLKLEEENLGDYVKK